MLEKLRSFLGLPPPREKLVFDLPFDMGEERPVIVDQRGRNVGVAKRSLNKKVKSKGFTHYTASARTDWVVPQYDHYEIEIVHDIEAYFARAIRAKLALFSKEGSEFVGPNDQRVKYVRTRIRQIEKASGIPFDNLLIQAARDLSVHANGYWLKVRDDKASGGRVRTVNKVRIKPVAGYFSLPPETMLPRVDTHGNIVGWKQQLGTKEKIFLANDIVHFHINKKGGYPLGVPSVLPALDDIHALRHIEENVEILIRKNLFPLVVIKVGTPDNPASVYPDGTSEIEEIQERVADMPPEGMFVVDGGKVDVSSTGSEGRALRVDAYLEHFKQRVFAGLDVSSVDMGVANTASRSSAQTMSRNLVDTVKHVQLVIANFINLLVIPELLLESMFPQETILDSENRVALKFREIDTEAKTAKENHALNLFNSNLLTWSETREELGREPLDKQQQKDIHWAVLGREQAVIRAIDESWQMGQQAPKATAGSKSQAKAKAQPQNQHGKRPGPKLNKDSVILGKIAEKIFEDQGVQNVSSVASKTLKNPLFYWHNLLRDEFQQRFLSGSFDLDMARVDIFTNYDLALNDFVSGLRKVVRSNDNFAHLHARLYETIDDRAKKYVYKLRDDIIQRLEDNPDMSPETIFNALSYRARFIYETERTFVRSLAKLYLARELERDLEVIVSEDACEVCQSKLKKIQWNDKLAEEKLSPFHPLCSCRVELLKE